MKTCTLSDCNHLHRARGLCSTHYNQQFQPDQHPPVLTACVVCGVLVLRAVDTARRHVCSVGCRRALTFGASGVSNYLWSTDAVSRARRVGAQIVDTFTREQVFERDAWTCYLCNTVLDPEAPLFDPLSPTVDHVIPLAQGGDHSLANARTACLHCNSVKADHIPPHDC
jgi:HNH endonuclease